MKATTANACGLRSARRLWATLFAALVLAAPGGAQSEGDDSWTFRWDEGFKLESESGVKLAFGGRLVFQFVFPDPGRGLEESFGPVEDAGEIRRGRLFVSGTLYERLELKMEFDFAGGEAEPTDVYLGLLDTPAGNVRVGHFYEPFSLEQNTSSKYVTFIERALPNAFSPGRNVGLMLHDTALKDREGNPRIFWGAGVFRESDGFASSRGDGQFNVTGRLAGLPLFKDGGRRLFHLGVSLTRKEFGGEGFVLRQRPEADLLPRLVDVGGLPTEQAEIGALEAAVGAGRFHAQGEYTWAAVDTTEAGELSFDGFYVQAGVFLTGEHRPYDHKRAGFNRLRVKSPFGKSGGRGAWEIAARYSEIDLTDGPVAGGVLDGWTLALNWYVNPVTRFQLNYLASRLAGGGDVDALLLGFQVDF